jgi:hypothetical protein
MPEIVKLLTDDHNTITHLSTLEGERISVNDLADGQSNGLDYYVTFDEGKRYTITIVAEDGHLEPTVDDPEGVHTIWDLPREEDPEESEIEEMFDEMNRMGEFNLEDMADNSHPRPEDLDDLR